MKQLLTMLLCLSVTASGSYGSILLWEDFEDSNASQGPTWTMLDGVDWQIAQWPGENFEAYNGFGNGRTRGKTPLAGPVDEVLYIQLTHRHAAGTPSGSNWGYGGRYAYLGLVDDQGTGLLFQAESSKNRDEMTSHIDVTTDWAQWRGFLGQYTPLVSYAVAGDPGPQAHLYQWWWNRTTGQIDSYLDGALLGTYALDPTVNAAYRDFTSAVLMIEGDDRNLWIDDIQVGIPEPATLGLIGWCGAALLWRRRRRRQSGPIRSVPLKR